MHSILYGLQDRNGALSTANGQSAAHSSQKCSRAEGRPKTCGLADLKLIELKESLRYMGHADLY